MIEAKLEGFCKEVKQGVRYNSNGVEIRMLKEGKIAGVALNGVDRSPITEFVVRFRPSGVAIPQGSMQTAARNREGKFEVGGLKPGLFDLEVKATDFAPTMVVGVSVSEGATSGPLEVVLGQGARLEGSVTQISHDPINRALVELDPVSTFDAKDKEYISLRGVCDAEGHYAIGKLLPGKYRLTVSHPKYANVKPLDIDIIDGTNRQDVILQQGATVSVYVRDAKGDPVAGVKVMLRDKARQYISAPGNRVKLRKDAPFMASEGASGGGGLAQNQRVTDKNGFIQFKRQDAGDYEIVITGEHYESFKKEMTLEYDKQYVETVTIKDKEKKS
jgi:hypothetical protein